MNFKQQLVRKISLPVWALVLGVLLILGLKGSPQVVEKEVVRETYKDDTAWRELKSIDDQGFAYCADFAHATGTAWTAIGRGDYQAVEGYTDVIKDLTTSMTDVANKRRDTLKKLGY